MANTFISIKDFARAALPRLIEHLVFPNLIYKDYSDDFSGRKGDTVQVRKPVVLTASEFDATQGVTSADIAETAIDVTLDKIATVDVRIEALQGATNIDDLTRVFIEPAAAALAQKINADGLELYKDIPNFIGTAGTTPATLSAFAEARKALNKQKAPVSGRVAIWDADADAAFTALDAIVHADTAGDTQALREGSIGRVMGLDNYMSQAVKQHACGTAQTKTLLIDNASGYAVGAKVLHIDGGSGAETVKKGDLLTIGGKQYAVTEDATFASGEGDVKITPPLVAAVADNAAVTMAASHAANLAFHPMAFAFVTRPLTAPGGVESYVTNYNGVSLRVVKGYDMQYKREMLSMDVLYGFKTLYPELAVRVLG